VDARCSKSLLIPDAVKYLLESTSNDVLVWSALSKSHSIRLSIGIFLHSWNEGLEIPCQLITEIGKRLWSMSFDLYSAEGEEIVDAFLSKTHD
jgi:hypothetical protein